MTNQVLKYRGKNKRLTPELIVVGATLCLSTAVAHLTAVLLIVYPKTEVFALENTPHRRNIKFHMSANTQRDSQPGSV